MVNKKKLSACMDRGHIPQQNTITFTLSGEELVKCSHCKQGFNLRNEIKRMRKKRMQKTVPSESFDEAFENQIDFPTYTRRAFFLFTLFFALTSILPQTVNALDVTYYPSDGVAEDGFVTRSSSAVWATLRSGAGTANSYNATTARINVEASGATNEWSRMDRAIIKFDTTAFSCSNTLTGATLSIYGSSKYDGLANNSELVLVDPTTAGDTTLASADFNIANWDFTNQAAATLTYAGFSTSGYNTYTLNATGRANINCGGITTFGLVLNYDASNTEPTYLVGESDDFNFYTVENGDSNKYPKINLQYSPPASSAASSSAASSTPDNIPGACATGTGCNLGSTGSLIITTGACDGFADVEDGSGNIIGTECTSWSTAIKIPALKFFVDTYYEGILYGVLSLVVLFIVMRWILKILAWFGRLILFIN